MITPSINVLLARSDNLSIQYAALSYAYEIEIMSQKFSIHINPDCFILGINIHVDKNVFGTVEVP